VSETPRTDAAYSIYDLRKVAQDIERELAEANKTNRLQYELITTAEKRGVDKSKEELNAANERIKLLEAVTNDPHALWANWLRGSVALPVGIGDVREYQERIKRLEEALSLIRPTCEVVHHSKKHQHSLSQPCPVVELIKKARFYKPKPLFFCRHLCLINFLARRLFDNLKFGHRRIKWLNIEVWK
jgi:hypothetical protein